jgi:hypothetical protein
MFTYLYAGISVFMTPAPTIPLDVEEVEVEERREPAPSTEHSAEVRGALEQRNTVRDIHRVFGVMTWISMAGTLALGALQLHDEYGPFTAETQTPCARGVPIVSQEFCTGIPWPHAISAGLTSALYFTTSVLSLLMPDPLHIEASQGWAGERLRIHKTLRWMHMIGTLLTSTMGLITANLDVSFETRQILATTHFALGATTFLLVSTAAIVMF